MKALKLSIVAAMMLAAGINTAHAQNADEIIQKHIDAIGGTKNWDKVKSMKMVGSMSTQGMEIGMTRTIVNGKGMRVDINAMGMNNYIIATPKGGWMYMPIQGMTKIDTLPMDQLKMYATKLDVKSDQLLDKSDITKAEYKGKDTVNNIACYKLFVVNKEGNEEIDYFDISTYYIVRKEQKVKGPDDAEQEIGTNFSNFQKQPDGVVVAMTVSSPQGDITFKSVEINKPVDDKIFVATMPAAAGKK